MRRLWLLMLMLMLNAALAAGEPRTAEPDETGGIPILMYHNISDRLTGIYNVPPAVFLAQLEEFYRAGFVLISLSDYLKDDFSVPRGYMPLILTFDDGRANNFRLLADGSLDPQCAVGLIEGFGVEHPSFGHTAVFFVNAGRGNIPFGDEASAPAKLQWLLDHGYDIGNHTSGHANLKSADAGLVRRQIGECQAALEELLPGLAERVVFFCYPYGRRPRDEAGRAAVEAGSWQGLDYRMELAMGTSDTLAPRPGSSPFEDLRYHLPRIEMHTEEGHNGHNARWVITRPRLYVSDGLPGTGDVEPTACYNCPDDSYSD